MHHALVLIVVTVVLSVCHALNCRSETGPRQNELKSVYMTCLKKQEGKNSSDSHGNIDDADWKDQRHSKFNQKKPWSKNGMRDEDPMRDRNDRDDRDDRRRDRDDRTGGRDDRNRGMSGRDNMNRNNMMDRNNGGYGREQYEGRYEFPQSEEYEGHEAQGMTNYNGYHSSTQPARRFKRSKRGEMNSGQRSQYNPNTKKPQYEESYRDDDSNSSNTSSTADSKACALHCFMEQLEMTGENGMPDKYLVTHSITKDVKNEDLRDFLQESIEECFQILDNENTEDKCEFSKNLMMCLSEKGRANCDDWKDDLKF